VKFIEKLFEIYPIILRGYTDKSFAIKVYFSGTLAIASSSMT